MTKSESMTKLDGFAIDYEAPSIGVCKITLALSALCVLITSCSTGTSAQRDTVAYVGTTEYTNKVNRLKVKPQEAQGLLVEHIRALRNAPESQNVMIGNHSILLNDSYHFYNKQKVGGIPLTGYYVDGNTGKIEFKRVEGSVPYPYQK